MPFSLHVPVPLPPPPVENVDVTPISDGMFNVIFVGAGWVMPVMASNTLAASLPELQKLICLLLAVHHH